MVAGGEEEADDEAGEDGSAGEVAEAAVVDDGERDEGEGHAEEIEEERGDVGEGVFDEGEGCSPDEDYGEEEDMGYGAVAETAPLRLLFVRSGFRGVWEEFGRGCRWVRRCRRFLR